MARRSLKPQLNQIRAWVQEGRTDAWIAHQLEIPASELREFRKQHDLTPDDEGAGSAEVDLRDEIEAEIEAATVEEVDEDEEDESDEEEDAADEDDTDDDDAAEEDAADDEGPAEKKTEKREPRRERPRRGKKEEKPDEDQEKPSGAKKSGRRRRRRGRRGGRGRRKELEATFDHGERDGYGLWLDPAVKDNHVYSEHWAGKREVTVRVEADQIVIRRAGESSSDDSND